MAGFTLQPSAWPRNFRPQPNQFGTMLTALGNEIGTGGITMAGTATTTSWIPIPAGRTFSVTSAGVVGNIPAAGATGITLQLIKQSGATATTLTAATSIKSDVITGTNVNVFDWPITQGGAARTLQPGDSLRWEAVAATTITTQPTLTAVVEVAIMQ